MRPFGERPAVVGHRGAPRVAPENTPASFAAACAAGATWVELDVRRCAAGGLVVHHDARTPDGRPVVEQTADDLAAQGIWGFEAVLAALPPGAGVDVEVKNVPGEPDFDADERVARRVAALLHERLDERPWMTSSFTPSTVAVLAAALPEVPAGLVHYAGLGLAQARDIARAHGAQVLCPQVGAPGLDGPGIALLHEAGLPVLVWTVDDEDEAGRLVAAGADALCTNEPARMVALLG